MTNALTVNSSLKATLDLEDQLCLDLYVAARAMTGAHRAFLAPLGLTYPQYLVMLALWQHGPQAVTELGAHLRLDSGTLSPLLKRLEATGYVTRSKGTTDERSTVITLTPAGAALKDRAATVPSSVACQLGLTLEEKETLQGQLRVLIARLQSGR